jgi:hypothetical protein
MKHESAMMRCHNYTALQCASMQTCVRTDGRSVQVVEDYEPVIGPLDSVICTYRELILEGLNSKAVERKRKVVSNILHVLPHIHLKDHSFLLSITCTDVCMYEWAIKLALAPRPLMIYCALPVQMIEI